MNILLCHIIKFLKQNYLKRNSISLLPCNLGLVKIIHTIGMRDPKVKFKSMSTTRPHTATVS